MIRRALVSLFALIACSDVIAANLVGIDSIGSYTVNTNANGVGGTRFVHSPFVASQSGTATHLFFYATDAVGAAPNLKLCIYSSAGSLLSCTGSIPTPSGPNWASGPLDSSVPIVSGTTYWLGWYSDAGSAGYRTTASPGDANQDDTGTFASPATTITATPNGGIDTFAMYADGTTASGNLLLRRRRG